MAGEYGYAGKILRADLTSGKMTLIPTSDYADKFVGGRGMAAKIYWDEVKPQTGSLDPDNRLILITGPAGTYPGVAGSMWQICGKSPAICPQHYTYSNLGGSFGAHLKFAGYDGAIIQGRADKSVYLLVRDDTVELKDASALSGLDSVTARARLKQELGASARVLVNSPAGENLVPFATVLADEDSAAWGFAAVMGSKNLKAVAVIGSGGRPPAASPEKLKELRKHIRSIKPHGPTIFHSWLQIPSLDKKCKSQLCYGCIDGCAREIYKATDGDEGKFFCQSGFYYFLQALGYYKERNEVPFQATRLADRYGLDTYILFNMLRWLTDCQKAGIVTEESTGLPFSKFGSLEFIETMIKMIARREGFGDILARGFFESAESLGAEARALVGDYIDRNGQTLSYGPRLYLTNAVFYATEPRMPISMIHEVSRPVIKWLNWHKGIEGDYMSGEVIRNIARNFWGSELAVDYSTYDGKALAAKKIQDGVHARESLGLCAQVYPITDSPHTADHMGDHTVESQLYTAITGNEVDADEFSRIGERNFNLQRAILIREGYRGREEDVIPDYNFTAPIPRDTWNEECLLPGKDGESYSRKGAVVDRDEFARMMDEYYELRGWDVKSGLPTSVRLAELGLDDVARDLAQRRQVV